MRKKLFTGTVAGILVFGFFLICQMNFAQNLKNEKKKLEETMKGPISAINDIEKIKRFEEKLSDLEKYISINQKYIDASQKNIDLWLKYLAFTLSVLIGYSIFNGLRSRELAKEELAEIRRIREEIKKVANETEERLAAVKNQITQIENTARAAKNIEEKMTQQLNEIGLKTDTALTVQQKNIIEKSINNAKEDLQKIGLDAFKNLYYAKALKANQESEWENAIRLWNTYIDLDDKNETAYFNLGTAYAHFAITTDFNKDLLKKALTNLNIAIDFDPMLAGAINNRATVYFALGEPEKALIDYNEAIQLSPHLAQYYKSRAKVFDKLGNPTKAEEDRAKAKELELESGK